MANLNLADQIRLRCACKKWLSLPLLDNHDIHSLSLSLLTCDDDIHWRDCEPKRVIIYRRLFDFIINENPHHTKFETSKHGWVISAREIRDTGRISFILFSPFTKETVKLPDFQYSDKHFHHRDKLMQMTFSSDPTSKECVFFIVFDEPFDKTKVAATYKHGYEKWITSESCSGMSSVSSIESMVYFEGDLYCYDGTREHLFVYNVDKQSWNNSFHSLEFPQYYYFEHHLVESVGELLLVCINRYLDRWGIYTFDKKSPSGWVVKTSLLNRALFIGRYNLISVPALGDFKHLENKIYYYDEYKKKSKFYSLIDGQCYSCEGTEYQLFVGDKV